jgi:hypothetical protein
VAGVGYLLPASTQNLVTASQLGTATNTAIIDATNRVAGVGYLLPASTNAIGAAFLASKGGVTNGGATLVAGTDISLSSTALSNGANITISYTGGGSTGGISASTATGISYAVTAEWATTGTASKATTVTGAQSNIIAAAITNGGSVALAASGITAPTGLTTDATNNLTICVAPPSPNGVYQCYTATGAVNLLTCPAWTNTYLSYRVKAELYLAGASSIVVPGSWTNIGTIAYVSGVTNQVFLNKVPGGTNINYAIFQLR